MLRSYRFFQKESFLKPFRRIYLVLLMFALPHCLAAQESGLGIGVIAGEPTGLSIKSWQTSTTSVNGALAWSLEGKGSFHFHGDYVVHKFGLIRAKRGLVPLYFGMGFRLRFREKNIDNSEVKLGIRVPVGLNFLFKNAPLDLFLEVVPILNLIPSSTIDLNAAIGIRFFF